MRLELVLVVFGLFAMMGGCVSVSVDTYVVPAISDTLRILPNSTIPNSYASNNLLVNVSKGETTDCSFVLNPKQTISNCNLSVSSFISGSNTLPASAIDIKYVVPWYYGTTDNFDEHITGRYLQPDLLVYDRSLIIANETQGGEPTAWNVSNPYGKNYLKLATGEYQNISLDSNDGFVDKLATDRPIYDADTLQATNLSANRNQQYLITVRIPANTTPGTYTGTITATDGTHNYKIISMKITVLPFQLDNSSIEYGLYYHSFIDPHNRAYIGWLNKSEIQYKAELEDLVDHGVIYPILNPGIQGPPQPNGINDTLILHELELRKQAGINDSNLYFWNELTQEQVVHYRDLCAQYTNQFYAYGPDENNINRTLIEYEHGVGVKHFNAQTITQAWNSEGILDYCICHDIYRPTADDYHANGSRIASYHQPMSAINYPELFRKNAGVVLWQNNYDGWFDFSYQWADNGDQWQAIWSYDNTVPYVFAYPTANGVVDTVKWEGVREGWTDTRYIATLQNLIDQNSSDVTAIEAQNYLKSLKTANVSTMDMYAVRTQLQHYIVILYKLPVNSSESVNKTTKAVTFTENSTGKEDITS